MSIQLDYPSRVNARCSRNPMEAQRLRDECPVKEEDNKAAPGSSNQSSSSEVSLAANQHQEHQQHLHESPLISETPQSNSAEDGFMPLPKRRSGPRSKTSTYLGVTKVARTLILFPVADRFLAILFTLRGPETARGGISLANELLGQVVCLGPWQNDMRSRSKQVLLLELSRSPCTIPHERSYPVSTIEDETDAVLDHGRAWAAKWTASFAVVQADGQVGMPRLVQRWSSRKEPSFRGKGSQEAKERSPVARGFFSPLYRCSQVSRERKLLLCCFCHLQSIPPILPSTRAPQ